MDRVIRKVTARQDLDLEKDAFSCEIDVMRDIAGGVISQEFPLKAFLDRVNPSKDAKILDVGCGTGSFAIKLSILGFTNVLGIDLSESRIRIARQKAELLGRRNIAFVTTSLQDLQGGGSAPGDDGKFDVITSLAFVHHFPDIEEPLGIMYDLLLDGGSLYAYEPNALSPFDIVAGNRRFCARAHAFVPRDGSANERFFTPFKLRKSLLRVGFKNVEVMTNFYHPTVTKLLAKVPVLGMLSRVTIAIARK